jgi:tetratricopeptide (TPR) repeat protein
MGLVILPLLLVLTMLPAADAAAQELRLKRDVPQSGPMECVPAPRRAVGAEQRREAGDLAAAASQASILGDNAAALDLLSRAALLDPMSSAIAYRHARTLEELGRAGAAVAEYCRYLALAPDAPDAVETQARLELLTPRVAGRVPADAAVAFIAGIATFDAGQLPEAEAAFTTATRHAPQWSAPVYNLAVVHAATGRHAAAAGQLRRYLQLSPDAADAQAVAGTLAAFDAAAPPGVGPEVLAAALVVPGLGQFTTGRPVAGTLVMGAAAASLAAGLLTTRIEVRCLTPPVDGRCPEGQVLREESVQPYRTAGIAGALAIAAAGAVEAWHSTRNRSQQQPGRLLRIGGHDGAGGLSVAYPKLDVGPDRARLHLLRLRF